MYSFVKKVYEIMCNDFESEREYWFNTLKDGLKNYTNKEEWIYEIVNLFNNDNKHKFR